MTTTPIDIARLIDDLPGVGVRLPVPGIGDVQGYTSLASSFVEGLGSSGVSLSSIAGMASVLPPPAGPMMAAGSAIVSVFEGLFGADAPPIPPPTIGGRDSEVLSANPLADLDSAVTSGKVISGAIDTASRSDFVEATAEKYLLTLDALVHGRSKLSDGSPLTQAAKHRMGFFLVYAGHKYAANVGSADRAARLREAGRLIEWAMPRVHLRELLAAWFFYRNALAGFVATGGHPGSGSALVLGLLSTNRAGLNAAAPFGWDVKAYGLGVGSAGTTAPVPGFVVPFLSKGTDWPGTRRLADEDRGYGVDKWRRAVLRLAMPAPIPAANGMVAFAPLDPDIVADELRDRYQNSNGFAVFEAGKTWRVKFPQSGLLTQVPETWTEAVKHALKLASLDATHVAAVELAIDDARASSRFDKLHAAIRRVRLHDTVRRAVSALAKRKKVKKAPAQRRTARVVGGGIAAAVAVALLLR